jgi:hypothetical protein
VGISVTAKRFCMVLVLLLGSVVVVSAAPSQAHASTDVMFLVDTTGSMGSAIQEAQEDAQEAMAQISVALPDVQFGLASMADYGHDFVNYNGQPEISPYDDENSTDVPWTLHQAITPNQSLISADLLKLAADAGGDGPEAYGRALFESATNPAIGWRPGARGVIVLIADNVPHDDELNQGIPEPLWIESPFNTGIDPGADNTLGTGDDLDWQAVLQRLNTEGKPLEYVDYFGAPEYFPYWQNWSGRTGGSALQPTAKTLPPRSSSWSKPAQPGLCRPVRPDRSATSAAVVLSHRHRPHPRQTTSKSNRGSAVPKGVTWSKSKSFSIAPAT